MYLSVVRVFHFAAAHENSWHLVFLCEEKNLDLHDSLRFGSLPFVNLLKLTS